MLEVYPVFEKGGVSFPEEEKVGTGERCFSGGGAGKGRGDNKGKDS